MLLYNFMLVYYYVRTTYICVFKKTVCQFYFAYKEMPWMVAKQQLNHVWKSFFFIRNLLIKPNFITFTINKRFIDPSHFFFLTGSSLTMTLIPRAQTFPSFLSHEPEQEEGEHQEEATPPSSGCEESCRLRPLQWQPIRNKEDTLPTTVERM